MRRVTFIAVAAAFVATSVGAEIIPSARRIQWDPGVRNGIRNRTTICANVKNAPYNAKGDGVTNDAAALQSAINACPAGQVVYVPAGTYIVGTVISITKDQITIRGDGIGKSIIKGSSGLSGNAVISLEPGNFDDALTQSPVRNLVSPTKDSVTLTTSAAHGWQVNDVLLVDQYENPSGDPPIENNGGSGECTWCGRANGNRPIGQWTRVVSVPTSTSVTVNPPLYRSYDQSPQAVKVPDVVELVGLEDLTIDNRMSGAAGVQYAMTWYYAVNSWMLRAELIGSRRRALWMYGGMWNTIRSSIIHEGAPALPYSGSAYGTDRGYGIFMGPWPTACLVEDSQFYNLTLAVAFEGAASGNVFAYNYVTDMRWEDNESGRMAVLGHGAHSYMNLIEGNWLVGRFGVDSYWGTQSHFTALRNRITQQSGKIAMTWVVDMNRRNLYNNVVGNVLGVSGYEDTYELYNQAYEYNNGPKAVYRLGYKEINDNTVGFDTRVRATLLRHGNWDSVSNGTVWDPAIADRTIPSSLYLSGAPTWWGGRPWPAIGPDLSPMFTSIPALERYNNVVPPAAPTNLRIVP
jgi:hypothetical protein